MDPSSNDRRTILMCVLLGLLTLTAYWPVRHHGFIELDDAEYVTANDAVRSGLSWAGVKWAFEAGHAGNWHPLTWLSHMLDVKLFGLKAGYHHLTNVVLHTASTILLFLLLQRMAGALWRSAIVAALFALHPLHVESVAWIAERKDVLSTFFFMLTLWAYPKYVSGIRCQVSGVVNRHSLFPIHHSLPYWLALLFFALGLMSKPMLVTLPFVLLLLDFWPLRRIQGAVPSWKSPEVRRLIAEKIPFLLLCVTSCALTYAAQKQGHAVASIGALPAGVRIENAFASYLKYLGMTFWPVNLAIFYPHPHLSYAASYRWSGWQVGVGALLLVAVSIGVCFRIKREPWLVTGWFWYLGTLVPVIGIVQVGAQALADRYTYIPLIGIFICCVWTVAEFVRPSRIARSVFVATGALALGVCLLLTRRQLDYWENDVALFRRAASVTFHNPKVQFSLGQALLKAGNYEEAVSHLRASLKDAPNLSETHYTLGMALLKLDRQGEAVEEFQNVLDLLPNHKNASDALVKVLVEKGGRLMLAGQANEAATLFTAALQTQPGLAENNLRAGIALAKQGQLDNAVSNLTLAAWLRPDNADAHLYLGMILTQSAKLGEAIAQFRRSIQLNPDQPIALNNLAWILATAPEARFRDGAEAIKLAGRACQLTQFKQPLYMSTLATAYAEAGRFDDAISTAERARELARQSGSNLLAEQNERMLQIFRSGKPFHQPARSASQ